MLTRRQAEMRVQKFEGLEFVMISYLLHTSSSYWILLAREKYFCSDELRMIIYLYLYAFGKRER